MGPYLTLPHIKIKRRNGGKGERERRWDGGRVGGRTEEPVSRPVMA